MAAPLVTPAEFKKLRWSLLWLLVTLIAGAAAVVFSIRFEQKAQADTKRIEAGRNEIRSKLARAQDEEKELREKIAKHQAMESRGILDQEHRLDWVEKIRQIKESRKLIDVQYELAPQQAVDSALVPSAGSAFEVMSSPMKLQMQLLHEEDLLNFLNDLRQQVKAYVRPRQCTLIRLPSVARETGTNAQLSADCQLDWITIREKS
ncbi:MAG: hypothetical protein EKK46_07060 [Rhodocyclaceae bacterium]|nr:MAG: hypothetical protein EKK46_07060 [Rhodocyclaceae bacterium]